MLTDWVLIGRLAAELRARLRGARVEDAGLLADGRVGLVLRASGARTLLAIDPFSSPPVVTLETGELGIIAEPGFVRAVAKALTGMTLADVTARRFDRLLRLSFAARSRFGVGERLELFVELVPRFGNVVLAKSDIVVAALKEFAPAENARRSIVAGQPYILPPLPAKPRTLAEFAVDDDAWRETPLYVYRRDGTIAGAYVAPLPQFEEPACDRADSLLDVFAELRVEQVAASNDQRGQARRNAVLRRIEQRERKLRAELDGIARRRSTAELREELRRQGEAIYATLHLLEPSLRDEQKDRAAKCFAEYKKLGKTLPHLDERVRTITHALEILDTLRWEAQRTPPERIDEVEDAIDEIERRPVNKAAPAPKRKRRPLEVRTRSGSRILIGRSPVENADLTFRVARPDDLWFHARGIPGAHVVLARDDKEAVPPEDLRTAASLAAYYSRGQQSNTVAVDFTVRKHVRKQRAAPPGLVWYTHAETLLVEPASADAVEVSAV